MPIKFVIEHDYKSISSIQRVEDLLCLAVLIASGLLPAESGKQEMEDYYQKIGNCSFCSVNAVCLACILNQ